MFTAFIDPTIPFALVMFIGIVLLLVSIILLAKKLLIHSGLANITINDKENNDFSVPIGGKLLTALADKNIFLSSACGGGGTCGQCRCQVNSGGGVILSTEMGHFTRKEIKENWRLACQVPVKENLSIQIDDSYFDVQKWHCKVLSNNNVATFIKELTLELPKNQIVDFKAGGFVQLEVPAYEMSFQTVNIDSQYQDDWKKYNFYDLNIKTNDTTVRAYSMANYPEEKGVLKFNIRIATPPPNSKYPPGAMSSYIFNLMPGDSIDVFGPYGDFFVKETPYEKIWIGGGAGMAPLRSQIFDELKRKQSTNKMSFWYGARSLRELFYQEDFDELQKEFPNFHWNVALSDPMPEDNWNGHTGFIHQVVLEEYLSLHPEPENCEYYLCGPPLMVKSVLSMLDDLGVEPENIALDDFGE